MPIPTRAIACQASRTNIVGPIVEYVKDKVDEIRNEIDELANSTDGRRDPTHVGFGIRFDLDISGDLENGGYASNISCRADLLSIDINDGDSISAPEHPTPAVQLDMDLRKVDSNGHQEYLLGGPLEPNRLKSIGASLSWNQENWGASATLNDAAFAGIVDWNSSIPGQLVIDEFATDAGFSECINSFLTSYAMKASDEVVDAFMFGFNALGLAEQVPITFDLTDLPAGIIPENVQEVVWQISSINLDLLVNSPKTYIESIFLDAYGNLDFNQFLSSAGNTLFEYLSSRIDLAEVIDEVGNSINGWLKISLPEPPSQNGTPLLSNFPISLNISPNGVIMLALDELSLGGIALNADISIDISQQLNAIDWDNISLQNLPTPTIEPLNFVANFSLGFANGGFGPLSDAQLQISYDRSEDISTGTPFTVNFSLPNLRSILDISHISSSGALEPQWEEFVDGLNLPIYPLPSNLADASSFISQLAKITPSVIIESLIQFAVDEFVLSSLPSSSLLGEMLEFLELAKETEEGSGNYRCNSFLSIVSNPLQHLEDIFFDNDVIDVSAVINFASILLESVELPINTTIPNELSFALSLDPALPLAPAFAEFFVKSETINSSLVIFGIRSIGGNGLSVLNGNSDEIVNIDFNLQLSVASDYSLSLNGSTVEVSVFPYELLDDLGLPTGLPSPLSFSFEPTSFVQISTSLTSTGIDLSLSMSTDGTTDQGKFATLNILPQFSGLDAMLNLVLGEVLSAILPEILDRVISKMRDFTFTSMNGTSTSAGDILSNILNSLGLIDLSDKVDSTELKSLMSNPKDWLMGSGDFTSGKIDDLIVGVITQTVALTYDINNSAYIFLSGLSLEWKNSPSPDNSYLEISFGNPMGEILHDILIRVGKIEGDVGINAYFTPTISSPSSPLPDLILEIGGGVSYIGNDFVPQFDLIVRSDASILSVPLEIWPAIEFGVSNGDFTLTLTSHYNSQSYAFWINILPLANGPLVKDTDYGIPDLSNLLRGVADQALGFIEGVSEVQTWLASPLYSPSGDVPSFATTLSDISIPGTLFTAFQIMEINSSPPPVYTFKGVQDIIDAYTNPLDVIIGGIMNLLKTAINNAGVEDKPGITLFEKDGTDFDFRLSLVDSNPGLGNAIIGLNFCFDEIAIDLGNLALRLFCQTQDELDYWTSSRPDFLRGITFYFVEWDDVGTIVTPHISLEIGGFGVELTRNNDEPLLDKFLLLNKVGFATALDLNIFPLPSVEFGGQLILDDFGISLGGDGNSDGGNGMAAGVLAGGDDDQEAIRPMFDLAISKYHDQKIDVSIVGETEFWFPINKQFGPIKIAQIGVRYEEEEFGVGNNYSASNVDHAPLLHRLSILVDGEAEIAGFIAQVDDLEVNMPLLRLMEFGEWRFDMAGLAVSFSNPSLEITGALRKAVVTDSNGNNPYIEYQGLCTISAGTFALSAIGAFGRVPSGNGDEYVTCFVIAALDTPLGGPPFFFVTGLMGGLGLNRQLLLPDVTAVPGSPFMTVMDGFGSNPMGALRAIQTTMPAEYGSFWFAVGLKFTTFQIVESKAVLFIKIDEGFTVGILGMSSLSLPSKEFNVGYVELAFLAYYSSTENLLWVEAQLTDASYLFTKSCRLTGGFALVNWFNTGEFLLSLGGYHPKFQVPSYYPDVPRLGFNWQPINSLTIKGEAYFTICSSAVMLGGGLSASYKSGCLSASFKVGMDVLVIFDPFYYNFSCYIGVSVRLKTWLGTIKGSLGADLEIEGPKMRGKARIEISFIEFTVKFGSQSSPGNNAISALEFINKHLRQLPEGSHGQALDAAWKGGIVDGKKTSGEWMNAQVVSGALSPSEAGVCGEQSPDSEEMPTGLSNNDPWLFTPEFSISYTHLMPATISNFKAEEENIPDSKYKAVDEMKLSPCFIDESVGVPVVAKITPLSGSGVIQEVNGLSFTRTTGYFADTIWTCNLDSNNRPKGKKTAGAQRLFFNGGKIVAKSMYEDASPIIDLNKIEECSMVHNLPLRPKTNTSRPTLVGSAKVTEDRWYGAASDDSVLIKSGVTVRHNTKPSVGLLDDIFSTIKPSNAATMKSEFSNGVTPNMNLRKVSNINYPGGGNK